MDSRNCKLSSSMDSKKNKRVAVVAGRNRKVKLRKQLHIHDDIAFSILSKLSIKSLRQFECVCKSWSLLLDNRNFMTMFGNFFLTKDHPYYDHTSLLLHGKFTYSEGEADGLYSVSDVRCENKVKLHCPIVHLEGHTYDTGFNILGSGSVNGTLGIFWTLPTNIVVLWNPSAKEFKVIPPSPFGLRPSSRDVFVSHRGFGYDRHSDDYKVINLREVQGRNPEFCSNPYIWEIYSLRDNSWRILNLMYHKSMNCEQLYMDGLTHWMCKSGVGRNETYLLSFDWSNEVFITTLVPSDIDDGNFDFLLVPRHLVLLNGSIALILNFTETTTFHIFVLGELTVKESWAKMFIIGPIPCLEYPIGAGKKGDMVFRKKDGRLVLFNLTTQTIEDLGIETNRSSCKILIHRENLIPIEGKGM